MTQDILSNMGFSTLNIKEPQVQPSEQFSLDISVTKPDDHKHPQLVFKLPRHILSELKWEITDRVKVMTKAESKEVALVRATRRDTNTFAISAQGASVEVAKQNKRGGIVKVGWRDGLCDEVSQYGTHSSVSQIMDKAIVVKLPETMFA